MSLRPIIAKKKNYTYIIYLICGILLTIGFISLVSSNPTLDNVEKIYDSETKTITLRDYFFKDEIAKITLNTPINNYVIRGKDRKVAEFTIESFYDYEGVFNNLEFYEISNDMKKLNRGFEYKYKSYYYIVVNDYQENCKEKVVNISDIEYYDCSKSKTGEHLERKFNWVNLNKSSTFNKGNLTIGIFTEVFPNEKIEWIPTFFNTEISEWAVWTEGLGEDLLTYWKFDETAGTNVPDSKFNYDLTSNSSNWTTNGLIGNGLAFNQTDRQSAFNDSFLDFNSTDLTFSFWFKLDEWFNSTSTSHLGLIEKVDNVTAGNFFYVYLNHITGNLVATYNGENRSKGGNSSQSSAMTFYGDQWYNVIFMWDGSNNNISLHLNGSTIANDTFLGDLNSTTANFDFGVGYRISEPNFNGANYTIDEVAVWNRTLSPSEISNIFNDGNGISYSGFNLNRPTEDYNTTLTEIEFNCSAESVYLTNLSLIMDDVIRNTISNTTEEETNLFLQHNVSGIPEGKHNWTCRYTNQTNDLTTKGARNFTIDFSPPDVNITHPANTTLITNLTDGTHLQLNWSINDSFSSFDTCWYSFNGTNTTTTCADNVTEINMSGNHVENRWNITFYANDTLGNTNSSSTYLNFSITNATINTPSATESSLSFDVNVTFESAQGLSYCYFNITTSGGGVEVVDTAIPNCNSEVSTSVTGDGNYVFNYWVNTTYDIMKKGNLSFSVASGVAGTGGGGGARGDEEEVEEIIDICEGFKAPLNDAWAVFNEDYTFENFKELWYSFWEVSICSSAGSIVPLK